MIFDGFHLYEFIYLLKSISNPKSIDSGFSKSCQWGQGKFESLNNFTDVLE